MSQGQRHLVQCRCYLPQFRKLDNPPLHQFPVFSVIEDDDSVRVKFAQCNNCGVIHKVTNISMSEIITGKEEMHSIMKISDIMTSLPEGVIGILESSDVDVSVWEHVKFIIDNQQWGSIVVLSSESVDGMRHGKYVKILGERLFKVDEFNREEYVRKSQ